MSAEQESVMARATELLRLHDAHYPSSGAYATNEERMFAYYEYQRRFDEAIPIIRGLVEERQGLREALRRCGELAMARKTGAIKHLVKTTLGIHHFSPSED